MVFVPFWWDHDEPKVIPAIGPCKWTESQCIEPATKYDNLCDSHRNILARRRTHEKRIAFTQNIFDQCLRLIESAPADTSHKQLAKQAANQLWAEARQVTYIAYSGSSKQRLAKNLVCWIFCLALARSQEPDKQLSLDDAYRKAGNLRIRLRVLPPRVNADPKRCILEAANLSRRDTASLVVDELTG